jgi:hypothetical protein
MTGRPAANEFAAFYSGYVDRVTGDDVVSVLAAQLDSTVGLLVGISEEQSRHRYAAGKWSMREWLNHVSDTERVFVYRALWFARGFDTALPGFDQHVAVPTASAERFSWASHVEDFRAVRTATLTFFRNLREDAWGRSGDTWRITLRF